jgi:thiol-disulfide isomerase/thioredoxin/outer membrane lipoprotein-sorting protein
MNKKGCQIMNTSNSKKYRRSCMPALCSLLIAVTISLAASAQIDPVALVDGAGKYLAERKSMQVDVNMTMVFQDGDQQGTANVTGGFITGKGCEAIIHLKTENEEVVIYNNPKKRDIHLVDTKTYKEFPAEQKRVQLFKSAVTGPLQAPMFFLADFLHGVDFVFEEAPVYAGAEEMDGTIHHAVDMVFKQYVVRAYISVSQPSLLRRIEVDLRGDALKSFAKTAEGSLKITADLINWRLDRVLPDDTFTFTPPAGVAKEKEESGSAGNTLVGKDAPDFTLPTLDGGSVTLSQHRDKDIVILDFWASWCGPCRQAMPIVSSVANSFKDKNVVLYAVNLRETPEKVRGFLASSKLSVNVLLDKGDIATKYGVSGIPRMVIIGKDGKIKKIHGGMSPDLERQLNEDLKELL